MREQTVTVRLKQNWLGNPPGSILTLNKRMADSLFRRDAGEVMKPETPKEVKAKLQRKGLDKMVRSSSVINKENGRHPGYI